MSLEDILQSTKYIRDYAETINKHNKSSHVFDSQFRRLVEMNTISYMSKHLNPLITEMNNYHKVMKNMLDQHTIRSGMAYKNVLELSNVALSNAQVAYLQSIVPSFSAIISNLTKNTNIIGVADLPPLGNYQDESTDATFEDENTCESENSMSIIETFQQVNYLPFRLMNAIAANPELLRNIHPRDFEKCIADLLASFEFENIILTQSTRDGGCDIFATKFVMGIPILFAFECKRYAKDRKIGVDIMRGLLGAVCQSNVKAHQGVLVTTSSFTKEAKNFIVHESLVAGKDFEDLVQMLSVYKSKIN
jgi:hypothetical protein